MGLKSGGMTGVPPNRGAMGGVWASIGTVCRMLGAAGY